MLQKTGRWFLENKKAIERIKGHGRLVERNAL